MIYKPNWNYPSNSRKFAEFDIDTFKVANFKTLSNYVLLIWGISFLKTALLISDIYTCIKLLAFNTWSNDYVKPFLPFRISKWLFSTCILISVLLLLYDVINGLRIYGTKVITTCYMNNFARTSLSLSNYSVFCFFENITPDNRLQKIAFFSYFELKSCLRLLLADSPRQVINGLTLWSTLIAVNNSGDDPQSSDLKKLESLHGLINKIKRIGETNHEEAVILSFMLFSFILWTFFISKFIAALCCLYYVYKRLKNEYHLKGGLREYIWITINYNIERLIDKRLLSEDTSLEKETYVSSDITWERRLGDPQERIPSMIMGSNLQAYKHTIKGPYGMIAVHNGSSKYSLERIRSCSSANTLPSYYYSTPLTEANILTIDQNNWEPMHVFTPAKAYFRDNNYSY
ncbi:pheromone-regulated K(+) transporter PRM6 NDAI_0G00200 [Naumovozyma dairenensis CBS 421]|uniref:Uncharacterized protein n=1 Tax=Naumovozyma dairenensis (strain ATCC 10597 / BCRC 20456 / CBS 421 / NBRC 0211 / NRRL Y-12639) TaxID=1071378 RepID=G0WDD5_NAUDC|nr:hypothetical protein NDAI_0G00200 [Naumovozyma dairenensis CBS 421]CCD25796.2 hypothetical protein NDAI_0G00200 [Naumovozyma dairenensis CBS 421]